MPGTAIVWFRRDLRLHDHPALLRAVADFERVVPLYVIDDGLRGGRWASANRTWFLGLALRSLVATIGERGGRLALLHGDPRRVVVAFATAIGAAAILASRDHEPYGRARDEAVAAAAAGAGIPFLAGRGLLVHEPEDIQRADGGPYSVFSPFHRRWSELPLRHVLDAPDSIATGDLTADIVANDRRIASLLGDQRPTADPAQLLEPGEPAARARLERCAGSDALRDYDTGRDRLAVDGTSRLSQDLRWGTLSPVEVVERCMGPGPGPARFRAEIAWRDFYAHLLRHEPRVRHESFRREFDTIAWQADELLIQAWRDGRTGYPIVDAAMRQLRATGWMHNRARMIVASFLTKHLLVDWRVGERHFMQHLVDGDPASNNGGWQWAASTGTDPQPYFRIFNPTLQGRRHDPDGDYVRRWVPELRSVAGSAVHDPPPGTYIARIIDHAAARHRTLAAFEAARAASRLPGTSD
ncbi:MAG: deoxyribodipyrimidine photo-lyase [Chloroflexi bacterium]|nr:deoxyribodipyrimidine photo-lyase [Chloroflexota bacterium]